MEVDLGIHGLATVSDGTVFENPRALDARLRKLKHLQREVSRKQKGSQNREKAKHRLSRAHAQVSNVRKGAINQATTVLARAKPVIVVEILRPKNLLKNPHLACSLGEASSGGITLWPFVRAALGCGWCDLEQRGDNLPGTTPCGGRS